MGFLAPPGIRPARPTSSAGSPARRQGEPYDDPEAQRIVRTLQRFHSPYHIDAAHRPPPLFVASGFTDDLFPVDEVAALRQPHAAAAIRAAAVDAARRLRPPARLQQAAPATHLLRLDPRWFDHHLRGRGRGPRARRRRLHADLPARGALRTRRSSRGPSTGACARARSAPLRPGRRRSAGSGETRRRAPRSTPSPAAATAASRPPAANAPGTATYRLRRVRQPLTLLGAPTIVARLGLGGQPRRGPGRRPVVGRRAGRQTQRLVARAAYRAPGPGRNVLQLHPAGWRFRRGHVPKLELLGNDAPYGRAANGEFEVTVKRLQLRLPVRQRPNCGRIRRRARPILPADQFFAPGGAYRPPGCRRRRASRSAASSSG